MVESFPVPAGADDGDGVALADGAAGADGVALADGSDSVELGVADADAVPLGVDDAVAIGAEEEAPTVWALSDELSDPPPHALRPRAARNSKVQETCLFMRPALRLRVGDVVLLGEH